jgi:hypothetical protein
VLYFVFYHQDALGEELAWNHGLRFEIFHPFGLASSQNLLPLHPSEVHPMKCLRMLLIVIFLDAVTTQPFENAEPCQSLLKYCIHLHIADTNMQSASMDNDRLPKQLPIQQAIVH